MSEISQERKDEIKQETDRYMIESENWWMKWRNKREAFLQLKPSELKETHSLEKYGLTGKIIILKILTHGGCIGKDIFERVKICGRARKINGKDNPFYYCGRNYKHIFESYNPEKKGEKVYTGVGYGGDISSEDIKETISKLMADGLIEMKKVGRKFPYSLTEKGRGLIK